MTYSSSHHFQHISRWKFFPIVCLLLLFLVGWSLAKEFVRTRDIEKQIASLQTQADALQAKNTDLTELRNAVQTESYIEREARLKLGLKKPGEAVVVVKGDQRKPEETKGNQKRENDPLGMVIPEMKETQELANSTKWWYYFFDKKRFEELSKP